MLVGIVGPCAVGNEHVASVLSSRLNFTFIKFATRVPENNPQGDFESLSISENDENPQMTAFSTPEQALHFVTVNSRSNCVFIHDASDLKREQEVFSTRPFYCSLGVKVSPGYALKTLTNGQVKSLQDLVTLSARSEVDHSTAMTLAAKIEQQHVTWDMFACCQRIITLNESHALSNDNVLSNLLDLSMEKLKKSIRPSWDAYFMEIAKLSRRRSNCMKRCVGAVLVSRQSHRIISTGYNGTPTGLPNCFEGGCSRCNGNAGGGISLSTCLCLHAEENALFEAGRERIAIYGRSMSVADTRGVALYTTLCPCIYCAKKIIQAGIAEVVYLESYHMDDLVKSSLRMANVELRMLQQ